MERTTKSAVILFMCIVFSSSCVHGPGHDERSNTVSFAMEDDLQDLCFTFFDAVKDTVTYYFSSDTLSGFNYRLKFKALNGSENLLPSESEYFTFRYHDWSCTKCSEQPEVIYLSAYGDLVMKLSINDGSILAKAKIPIVGNRAFQEMKLECFNNKLIISLKDNLYIYGENLDLLYDYHEDVILDKIYNSADSIGKLMSKGTFFFFGLNYEVANDNEIVVTGTFRKLDFDYEDNDVIDSIKVNRIILDELK